MNGKPTADAVIAELGLTRHVEGVWFREMGRSPEIMESEVLPNRYSSHRHYHTLIYFMITPTAISLMHRLKSDEVWHWYAGDPVEALLLHPEGDWNVHRLGPDVLHGERPQLMIPHGVWQGGRVIPGGEWALLGATVAPGFEFADFELGTRSDLLASYPSAADSIMNLTT